MKKTIAVIWIIIAFFVIYFLQSNFFTWFNIAGVMPNLYVILVLFIGLFLQKKLGLTFGIFFGLYLDIVLGKTIGISALILGIIGFIGEILSKNFSKDSRFTIMIMVILMTIIYEASIYFFNIIKTGATIELISFIKILAIECFFNSIITVIIYPLIKKAGYYFEDLFEKKAIMTKFF